MKPFNKIFALLFLLFIASSCAVQQRQPVYSDYSDTQQGAMDYQLFYDELSPYGRWVEYSNYGYVWLPDVRHDFTPYSTNGYWVNTDYGWTWVSNYRWGWAPFHYGRWDYDDFYGWFWVPDNEWGPSWVTWRSGNGYYGWAPMRPGMDFDRGYNDGYRDINRWNFVRSRDFGRSDIQRYYIDRREYTTIINNSRVINNTTVDRRRNTTYVAGPPLENVQRETGRRINRVNIQDNDRPGEKLNNKELRIYRPRVQPTTGSGQRPAPSKVTSPEQVKSARDRNVTNPRDKVAPIDQNRREQPGEKIQRRRRDIQSPADRQNQQRQQTQPTQQPRLGTPQQQPNERRRLERQQGAQPQSNEKSQPLTPQEQQQVETQRRQQIERQEQQVERQQRIESQQPRRRQGTSEELQQQNEKSLGVQPQVTEPQVTTQQQQIENQQRQQVERQRQKVERQEQQMQRRQERQQIKEQQQQVERENQQRQRSTTVQPQTQAPQVSPQPTTQQQEEQKPVRRRQERQP